MAHNVQFTVATHIMAVLAFYNGKPYQGAPVTSAILAGSVGAEPSFVRRTISKLAKAGLVTATRGKKGDTVIARKASEITMLDIYLASGAPEVFTVHNYPPEYDCPISPYFKDPMSDVKDVAQAAFEKSLSTQTLAQLVTAIKKNMP